MSIMPSRREQSSSDPLVRRGDTSIIIKGEKYYAWASCKGDLRCLECFSYAEEGEELIPYNKKMLCKICLGELKGEEFGKY